MKKTLYSLIALTIAGASIFGVSSMTEAQYTVPGFTLTNDSTCVGGTMILQYGDVQDTGAGIAAKALAVQDCQYYMTGPNQCCSVKYRRATPAPPAIGSHVFQYEVYQGGVVGPSTPPPDTATSLYQHWAGVSSPANSCMGTWQLASTDMSDVACTGSGGVCVPNANNTNIYSALATCPSANPDGVACKVGDPVLLRGVKGPLTYGTSCKWNSVEPGSNIITTNVYNCVGASGSIVSTSCDLPAAQVTADLVANPNSIELGEQSLLTWTSTGATSCTSSDFTVTNSATQGSTPVAPTATKTYTVTCTGAGGSADASATVSVSTPGTEPELAATCRVHPTSARTGETVLWSSTVTGPQGLYAYSWSGSENLSGVANQVFKTYASTGQKTASLTVTYTPPAPVESSGAESSSVAPSTTSPTTPPTAPTTPALGDGLLDTACTTLGWTTPITACAGSWSPTYSSAGCQNGWQCTSTMPTDGGGGGTLPAEDTSFLDSLQELLRFESSQINEIPEIQTVDGSVLAASVGPQTITVQCENAANITTPPVYQCSDGIDNDDDGLADEDDPGCYVGGTPGGQPGGPGGGTYNSGGGSEGTTPNQCTTGLFCKGTDVYSRNAQCVESFVKSCPFGCLNGECIDGPAEEPDLTLNATPPLIKKGQSCTLAVSARSVTSCSLTGSGVSVTFPATGGIVAATTVITPSLTVTSPYKLTCTGTNGATLSKTVECKIAPSFEEF
ncbi:MAG: hypothetical protein AAB955_00950 [Patescibacteria group bacterium]